jgi:D-sedoheptulose 7-phosphate isomerase
MEIIVFTNGCFDIIHPGHVDLLERARALGTKLIVGINSDESVRAIKGIPRPFMSETERAEILRGLRAVDEVRIFGETTPARLIEEIKPDVLVKGGDWEIGQIVGADFVLARGGSVHSLPLKAGFSSSSIIEKIRLDPVRPVHPAQPEGIVNESLRQHIATIGALLADQVPTIEKCGAAIVGAIAAGKKILLCGNGGSAADAQHIATEFVGRYEAERRGLPAIALTTDTSLLTAVGNDYGFERVFSRQVEALASEGDVLIGITTSGNSPNVLAAVMAARQKGCTTIGLTGANGKKLAALCDLAVLVPSDRTARIQEAHITIGHLWCEMTDIGLLKASEID